VDSVERIKRVAAYWAQASNEVRAVFVSRFVINAGSVRNKDAPTPREVQLGILLAEAEQGTADEGARKQARAVGQGLGRR
jgi:hypothetical protein